MSVSAVVSSLRRAAGRVVESLWDGRAGGPKPPGGFAGSGMVECLEPRYLLAGTPIITEFLSTNSTGVTDENGDHSDWLELYNPGADVNLNGYYLTDSADNLTKWQLPAVTLPAGAYMTVWADTKDRRVVGSPLHTNFSLGANGGYLALVAPDGVSVLSSYSYPQQLPDVSYGVMVNQNSTDLITTAASGKVLVPTDGTLGATWIDTAFDDSSWTSGTSGFGYETDTAQPQQPGFSVRMVDTQGGTDGQISNIGEATNLLNGTTPAGAFTVVFDGRANRSVINLGDGGAFGGDLTLPNGLGGSSVDTTVPGRTQYALRITSDVTIPAGTYTINVNSDDGFRLRIPGVTFSGRVNENFTGATNPSPADTLAYGGFRGAANTLASFTVPAGGLTTTINLDYFQGVAGGNEVELSLASGARTAFDTTNFQLLQNGLFGWTLTDTSSPPPPNYKSLLGTDLQASMFNKQNTAYIRIPFTVKDPGDFDVARLQIKYDDGFIAYVNGHEIARRNAPTTPVWNSAATGTNPDTSAIVYETIGIPTADLVEGQNVLSIQGLNAANDQPDFLIYPIAQGLFTTLGTETYFSMPTPGAANVAPTSLQFVADTKFNVDRGFYAQPFQLTITTATPGAMIRYTTDGTAPTVAHGTVYTGPITIGATTTLRAAAFKTGMISTDVDTESYIFISDVINQPASPPAPGFPSTSINGQIFNYGMDQRIVTADPSIIPHMQSIPSVSLVMDPKDLFDPTTGIYTHATSHGRTWERPTSIEFLYPDGTTKDIQANAGVRIRGGYSRSGNNPKHGLRIFFRSDYGQGSLDDPIMGPNGASSFSGFDLRTFENYSWSFEGDPRFTGTRDMWSRMAQLAMGHQAERGDYYNLYINGQYWGIYNTDERAEADYAASYFGGSKNDYDVIKTAEDAGATIEATDGNMTAWTNLWNGVRGDMTNMANYEKLLGNNPDGTRNPAYPVLLDPVNLIDYMLLIYYTGNLDAPLSSFINNNGNPNNFFAIRDRVTNDQGFQFFAHDSEHTFLDVNADRTGPFPIVNTSVSTSNPQWMFQLLVANPEFQQLVNDRIQKWFFNGGVFTPQSVNASFATLVNDITGAIYGESARWGDSKRNPPLTHADWQNEVNSIFSSYIPQRTNIVLGQLRARGWFPTTISAPTMSQYGGKVAAGTKINLGNSNGGGSALYYTLDGSDPRLLGGGLSPTAIAYNPLLPIPITHTTRIRARVLSGGTTWSPEEDRTFTLDTAGLKVTEVMYHPPAPPAGSPYTPDDFEFLELFNSGTSPLDLSGMHFTNGVTLTFASGTTLAPGARGVIVKNPAAFQSLYGNSVTILGSYSDKLSDGGERVTLVGANGETIFHFTYGDGWYPNTDGGGYSLVVRNPLADPATLNDKSAWRPSNDLNGMPGGADPGVNPDSIVVNELMANTTQPTGDWVELYNTTNAPIDLSQWFLSDSALDLRKYQIPTGTTIAAHGYLVLNESTSFGQPAGSPGVNTPFGFSGQGDSVHLSSVDSAGNVGGYQVQEDFAASDPETSFGRYTNSAGDNHFTAMLVPTPGAPNSIPKLGPVVINELHYYPLTGQEFIELRNLTASAVALYDPANPSNAWKFTNGIDYTFPAGASIPAFGYALVVGGDPVQFRTQNNVPASVPILGPYTLPDGTNVLANSGERITLSKPAVPIAGQPLAYIDVDSVKYNNAAPWPTTPAGAGPSLARVRSSSWGDDPANWLASFSNGGTPGSLNFNNATVIGRRLFYNASAFDGKNPFASPGDDGAIDTTKSALLPGQTTTAANITGTTKGINGVMIDVAGLGNPLTLSASDFVFRAGLAGTDPSTWSPAPAPRSVTVRPGAGATAGSDRVTIVWADGSITNQWLQVTVKAGSNTGLPVADVFYFGNLVGDTGNDPATGTGALVSAADLAATRVSGGTGSAVFVTTAADLNKDGVVDSADATIARANNMHSLLFLAAPAAPEATEPPAPSPAPVAPAPAVAVLQQAEPAAGTQPSVGAVPASAVAAPALATPTTVSAMGLGTSVAIPPLAAVKPAPIAAPIVAKTVDIATVQTSLPTHPALVKSTADHAASALTSASRKRVTPFARTAAPPNSIPLAASSDGPQLVSRLDWLLSDDQ